MQFSSCVNVRGVNCILEKGALVGRGLWNEGLRRGSICILRVPNAKDACEYRKALCAHDLSPKNGRKRL
jgi:hypothetical protein